MAIVSVKELQSMSLYEQTLVQNQQAIGTLKTSGHQLMSDWVNHLDEIKAMEHICERFEALEYKKEWGQDGLVLFPIYFPL